MSSLAAKIVLGVVPSAESYPYEAEEGQCRQANLENSLTKMNVVGKLQLSYLVQRLKRLSKQSIA